MRKFWIVFFVACAVVGFGLVGLWRAVQGLGESADVGGGVLVWEAEGTLPEDVDTSLLARVQRGDQPTFTRVVRGLRRAAADPEVTALALDLRGLAVSWAQLEELRAAVVEFRASGKPVWACLGEAGLGEYGLALAADRVALAPEGSLAILGVAAELAFIKDTLDKVGIAADFVSVGKYKSAPEQFTRSGASPESREVTEAIVQDRYDQLVDMIAAGRGVPADEARAWIDRGLFDAPSAFAAGLVDTIAAAAGLVDAVFPGEETSDFDAYARTAPAVHAGPVIALVHAAGTIMTGESAESPLQGRILGSETLGERLREVRDDDEVAAVVVRIDSPGGSVLASDLIWQEMQGVRESKPLVVSMGTYAASGGYYIACGADSIFADAATLTGSIGVFAGKLDWSELYGKIGVNREFVTRGENALMFSDATGFSPAQRAMFQAQLDRFYERFLAKVAAGRGLDAGAVAEVAQGRVWTGRQAREVGLVDGVGGLDRAVESARRMLDLAPHEPSRLQVYEEELSWLERVVLQSLDQALARRIESPAPAAVTAAARHLARSGFLAALPLLDGQPLALAPYRLVWEPRGS